MTSRATVRNLTGALLAGVALLLFASAADAAQTASGTTISNSATVDYSVNSVSQTPITSTAATFKVDKQLLITVTRADGAKVVVTPGATLRVLTFTVTNSGNSTEDVQLAYVAEASGTADPFGGAQNDNFDATSVNVFVENGVTAGFQSAQDTATAITGLAAGGSKTVYIVSTIPSGQVDGDVAVYALKGTVSTNGSCATACVAETQDTTTDKNTDNTTLNTVYNVFADTTAGTDDGVRDGISSDRDAYLVHAAQLTISKSSVVLTDPVNCTTPGDNTSCSGNLPRAIPGAVIQYTITVSNSPTASSDATGITVTDDLTSQIPSNITWTANSLHITYPGGAGAINPCSESGTASTDNTPAYGTVSCDYNVTTSGVVTVSGITLAAGESATVIYRVTINQ